MGWHERWLAVLALVIGVFGGVLGGATAGETIDLIDANDPTAGWRFNNGAEFPGAKGGFAADAAVEAQRRPALRVDADLTGGGNYVDINRDLPAAEAEELSFWLKAPTAQESLTVRLVDGSGQCHQLVLKVAPGGAWQQVRLPLREYFAQAGTSASVETVLRHEHWGGANDGKWHQPAKTLAILGGAAGAEKKTAMWISGLKIRAAAPKRNVVVAREVRLDDFLRAGEQAWSFNNGQEFPGAKGGITVVKDEPTAGEFAMKISGDFTGGGAYVDAGCDLGGRDVTAIRFRVKTTNAKVLGVRLIDGTDQCHQAKGCDLTPDGQWHEAEIVPTKVAGGEHWGGANDGKWAGAAKSVHLLLGKDAAPDAKPEVMLCDIRAMVAENAAAAGEAWQENFDAAAALPAGWEARGGGTAKVIADAAFAGAHALRLERPENRQEEGLEVLGPVFKAAPGRWTLSGAARSALHSPDNSFHVRFSVDALAGGKRLERLTVTEQTGARNWRAFRRTLEFPAGTDAARVAITYEKTFGTCDFDALAALPVAGRQEEKLVDRVMISTPAFGNLLLPEDPVRLDVEVRAFHPLPPDAAALATVTDYWGAEQFPASKLKLERAGVVDQRFRYRASLELPKDQVELGKYHELHVAVTADGYAAAREYSAFARLPEAESRRYPPKDIPFTIRSWDNRIPAYMKLASRLGHRNLGTWGGWDSKDPTKVHVPTLELCRELGNDWVTGTPASAVERQGFKEYSEENLREGTKNFLKKYAGQGLSYICLGNEPPERPDKIAEKVRAYRAVYEAAKEVAPEIPIIATSVPPLKTFFDAGYHKYCDIYDFHVYETYENVRQAIRRYKELMREYDAEKPIFCTELGLNSQGQTRHAVAQEVVKKITAFFAEGGANVSWFGIEYPDGEGKARGTSGNAHNVFDCQYCLYNPRLDAIMYYNMINGITVKKFVSEVQHPEGVQDFLFRDAEGNAFHVLWNEMGRMVCGLSLPGVDAVRLIRIDGSGVDMAPENGVLTVTVSPEPILLRYRRPDAKLAEKLAAPAFNASFAPQVPQGVPVDYLWRLYDIREEPPILKGQGVVITLTGAGLRAADFRAVMPPGWKAEFEDSGQEDGISCVHCVVTVPPETAARVGRVMIQKLANGRPCGELCLPLTLMSPLTVAVSAAGPDGKPRLAVRLANHGVESREASWVVELEAAFGIARGVFNLEKPEHCDAYLKGESEGAAKLAGLVESMLTGQPERVAFLTIEDCDPQTIYRVRTTVTDERGGRLTQARYVGGFAEAKRVAAPVAVDGKLDEPAWAQAKVMKIREKRQMFTFDAKKLDELWNGPEDLSARWRALWDDANLYLAVEVTDDAHHVQFADGAIWNQDGLQFLFDPARLSAEKAGKYDYSVGAGTKGPQAWCHLTADANVRTGEAIGISVAVADLPGSKGGKVYEIAIPWWRLRPFKPAVGADLGMSLILNEDDGDGRCGFMGWFSGVHSKELDLVGDLVLTE